MLMSVAHSKTHYRQATAAACLSVQPNSRSAVANALLAVLTVSVLMAPVLSRADAVILLYHHIASDTPPSTSTSESDFRSHLDYLRDNNFSVVPLGQVIDAIREQRPIPDRTAVITFDDGYQSIYDTAFPILQQYGYPFTLFLSTGPIDQGLSNYMDWQEIRQLSDAGVTIANHLVSHPYMLERLDNESDAQWLERIRGELLAAEEQIEQQTGQSHRMLAYTYGEYNTQLQALLEELDFAGLAQNSGAVNQFSPLTAIPRFPLAGIYAGLESGATKISSKAFTVERVDPADPVTDQTAPAQTLRFMLGDYSYDRIACFAGGETMDMTWQTATDPDEGRLLTITPPQRFSSRRWNYICTAPAGEGRYYWYSTQWINPAR